MTNLRFMHHWNTRPVCTAIAAGISLCTLVGLSTMAFANEALSGNSSSPQAAKRALDWHQTRPTGRLIVKYHSAHKPWQSPRGSVRFTRVSLRAKHKLHLERSLSDVQELVSTQDNSVSSDNIDQLKTHARSFSAQPQVEYASVEYRRYTLLQPNDPLYQGAQNPGDQTYLYDGEYSLHAPGAWDITTGASSSVIAIVDTGILPNHPEIKNRSVEGLGYDFVSADNPQDYSSANDGDGRDPNPVDPGDPCNGSSSSWHGTSVASTAAGTSNNSEGLAGIDWNARLLHARALGICGGTDADIIDAIRWSAGLPVEGAPDNPNPANVVNLSLGGATECTKAWQDVIDELADQNIVFVMAAGNETLNALRSAPANCANVITVGSSTPGGGIDGGFSNYGLKVTISTAGRNIVVASNRGLNSMEADGNYYQTEKGTSFSAALVSGAISLMHSLNPNLGPNAVRALLNESATPYAAGTSCDQYYCGGGVLNIARALNFLQSGSYNPDRDMAAELLEGQATLIPLSQETSAALFGFKDIRYFSLFAPERGLLQVESSSTEDLYGYMLNDDLSVIALDDDSGDSTNFRVASLVNPGTYYIAVEREGHRLSDGELPFTLATSLSNDAPAPFSFTAIPAATANAVVESNTVTISGLLQPSVLTIADGFYSLNGGDLMNSPATIRNGDTLVIATQSHGNPNSTNTATVTVGTFSTLFSVTTAADGQASGGSSSRRSSGCSVSGAGTTPFDPLFILLLLATLLELRRRSKS